MGYGVVVVFKFRTAARADAPLCWRLGQPGVTANRAHFAAHPVISSSSAIALFCPVSSIADTFDRSLGVIPKL